MSGQQMGSATQGMLAPAQALANSETMTIASGSVTQISGTTVNGYTPAVGDRILIITAPASSGAGVAYNLANSEPANGLYKVVSNTTNLTLVRAPDMAGPVNPAGLSIYVENGTWLSQNVFTVTSPASAAPFIYGTGNISFWTTSGKSPLFNFLFVQSSLILGGTFTLATGGVPASSSATGSAGQVTWDSGFIYICTATNTWKRVAIASW